MTGYREEFRVVRQEGPRWVVEAGGMPKSDADLKLLAFRRFYPQDTFRLQHRERVEWEFVGGES